MQQSWSARAESAAAVAARVQSGMRVFVHGAAMTPTPLLDALVARPELRGVRLYHLHLEGPVPFARPGLSDRLRSVSFFTGAALRQPIADDDADFIPVFLSDIPGLFTTRAVPLDVALVQLSLPDAHGLCTLGTSVDAAKAAVESAGLVLAEINAQVPRTLGNTVVPLERVAAFVLTDRPLHQHPTAPETEVEARIGDLVASLVEDGSTLQMGIGGIPGAVLARLHGKRDLGVHTEMFSDRLLDLIEAGVVTNRLKVVHPGRTVTSFIAGTRRLFDYVHDNPLVEFHPADRTNDTSLIRRNPRVVAVNSALQVDLTGQVCADSLGHRIYSGIGGQMDFIRGAALSPGGKPIIALPAMAAGGTISRIVPELSPGAGVVTTRGHVHWIVTEFGAAFLHGKTLRERAEALIAIAHPDARAELRRDAARIRGRR